MNFSITPGQKLLLPLILTTCSLAVLHSQSLQVTDANTAPYSPLNLISNVFLGSGVDVVKIQYAGPAPAVGYFSGGSAAVGLDRGIILTTGLAANDWPDYGAEATGKDFASYGNSSNAYDSDLEKLTTDDIEDVAVYTITFVPTSDTLRFRYCFASEEYPEFGCSDYNDVFGFFIQGPGYPTPTNIAKIPGTNLPVTINNIHPLNPMDPDCDEAYVHLYNSNNNSNKQPTYDGFTDIFTAMAVVQPCKQYTIKLAIADVYDDIYDSAVFLEAKSFGTGALQAELATASADGSVAEGCASGMLTFTVPNNTAQAMPLDYKIWGTATNGVDYQSIPANLSIPPGQSSITVNVVALEDGLQETGEFIAIDYQKNPCSRDTIYISIADNKLLPPNLRPDTSLCVSGNASLPLDATLSITLPQPKTFQNLQDVTIPIAFIPATSTINVSGVFPKTLGPGIIERVCMNIDHQWVDDLDVYLIAPGGQILELTTDNGGAAQDYTKTCFTADADTKINFPGPTAPPTAAPFTGDWLPEGVWADLWDNGNTPTNGAWKLQVTDDKIGLPGTILDWSITFAAPYSIDYQWTPSSAVSCDDCPKTTAIPSKDQTIKVTATDTYGCSVSDSVSLKVAQTLAAPALTCGVTTPTSLSFLWGPVAGALGYEINVNGTGWTPAPLGNTFSASGLSPGDSITLEVRALGQQSLACPPLVATQTCYTCKVPKVQTLTTDASCFGMKNGAITLSTDNLNPPYSFSVGGQSNSTGIFNGLAAGDYFASITDATGCIAVVPFFIDSPDEILASTDVVKPVSCNGGNDGSLTVTVNGGAGGFSYHWADPGNQMTPTATNLPSGNYFVTVTDQQGCTTVVFGNLDNPPAVQLSTQVTDVKCFGQNTGSAIANASGGTGTLSYLWSNGQTTPTTSNLPAGTYSVTATDAKGCWKTSVLTVNQPAQLAGVTSSVSVKCFSESSGSASVIAGGGTQPFSYRWNDSKQQTTPTATGLSAKNYAVTITDANGCTFVQNVAVSEPSAILATVSSNDARCFGQANGSATVSATGGVGGFTYHWSDPAGQSNAGASNLAAGNFTVTITDANGCSTTTSVSLGQPADLQISGTVTNAKCFGNANGQISLTVAGGAQPFNFKWSSGETTAQISGKTAGTYSATVTDANGCTKIFTEEIRQPAEIEVKTFPEAVKCFDEKTGSIQLELAGGTPGYSTAWSGPGGFTSAGVLIQNLPAGTYVVTVTDAKDCKTIQTSEVSQPSAPLTSEFPKIADRVCFGATDGKLVAEPKGGTPPYQFLWSAGAQTAASISNLTPGFYYLTITDSNGCKTKDSTTVAQRDEIFTYLTPVSPKCHDGHDGQAVVSKIFYGATSTDVDDFIYVWNTTPPQTGFTAQGLAANGTYQVTASDSDGCTSTQTVTLGNPEAVEAAVDSFKNVNCKGMADGWATISGRGGAGNFSFLWSPNTPVQTGALAQNLPAGSYVATVTDANGCFTKLSVKITEPPVLHLSFLPTNVQCFGEANGKVEAMASGGTPGYKFSWSNGTQTAVNEGLAAGMAAVVLTDKNGCRMTDSVLVKEPATPVAGVSSPKDAVCYGSHNGSIVIQADGGTAPYRYSLDGVRWNGSSKQIGLQAGKYQPWVMDKNGCKTQLEEVVVSQRDQIQLELGPDITISLGESAQLIPTITGAAEPLDYVWSSEDSIWLSCLSCPNPFVDSLYYQNEFELYIIDSMGCSAEDRILVVVKKERRVFVPTGFSPNADTENDLLLVHGQQEVKILNFRVFDRWGEVVFEASDFDINDPTIGWDGNFRGKPMDAGVYVWTLEVEYKDFVKEVFKGNTTLLR